MFDLGSIVAHIKADVSDFKKGVSEAHEATSGLAGKFEGAVGSSKMLLGGVAAAGAGVLAFAGAAVKAYGEQQDAEAQMDAVLNSTHHAAGLYKEDLMQQADALQSVTKFSNEQVMATQNMLLTFTNIHGPVMQRATGLTLDMAQALGMDGTQAAMQLGKALNDPAQGMTKLQRIGVTFTDQQKEQAAAMQAAGNTAGAQKIILDELSKEFGGSATAAGKTLSGQLIILKNNFGDMLKPLGLLITQGIQPLLQKFNDMIAAAGGPEAFANRISAAFQRLIPFIWPVATAIGVALVPALWALASSAAAAAIAFIAPLVPFLLVGAAVGALIQHFGGLHMVISVFRQVWDFLKPSVDALWQTIQTQLLPTLMGVWNMVAPFLIPTLKFLAVVLGAELVGALYIAINVLRIIISVVSSVIGIFYGWVGSVWSATSGIRSAFGSIVGSISGALGGVYNAITGPFRSAFDWLWGKVDQVVNKLKDLNPFMRHSPSLYDLVSAGTRAIAGEYQNMFDVIGNVPSAASLAPTLGVGGSNPSQLATAGGGGGGGTTVHIDMSGVMASGQADLRAVGKTIIQAVDEELTSKGHATILPAGVRP